MARPRDRQSQPDHQLSSDQQDLLLAALSSHAAGPANPSRRTNDIASETDASKTSAVTDQPDTMNATPDELIVSPDQTELEKYDIDFTPDLDYLDGEGYDFENADLGGEMIGALPGSDGRAEQHEKRKNSEDDVEEGDAKRQETQEGEKGAKKPGRKPLTSEPTTKRKAQNRAAQRAFRERKEKHVKDLETKVSELTKAGEADKHENGLLKAQIDRLQIELREYRKRLSLNGGSGNRSPSNTLNGNSRRSISASGNNNDFQFEFPKFGALPGSLIFGNQSFSNSSPSASSNQDSTTPPTTNSPVGRNSVGDINQQQREGSAGRSASPQSMRNGSSTIDSPSQLANMCPPNFTPYNSHNKAQGFTHSSLPQMNGSASDPFDDLFSPSILKTASIDGSGGYFGTTGGSDTMANQVSPKDAQGGDNSTGLGRVFQFNGGSNASDSASPSTSSSHWNANANSSSCGTSPEPSHSSPGNKDKVYEQSKPTANSSVAVPNQSSTQNQTETSNPDYGVPTVDSFDPVLFSDYRESNDAIVGGGDFTGGFFDDALNPAPYDLGSPSNLFGILQSPRQSHSVLDSGSSAANPNASKPSQNLMAQMNKAVDGGDDDYGLPGKSTTPSKPEEGGAKMISCNNIWSQLQANPDFQDGKFDLDNLCAELRSKARCSISGVIVDQNHVDAALRKLGKSGGDESQTKAEDSNGAKAQISATGQECTKMSGGSPNLMFEQQSWDNVLKKLSNNRT